MKRLAFFAIILTVFSFFIFSPGKAFSGLYESTKRVTLGVLNTYSVYTLKTYREKLEIVIQATDSHFVKSYTVHNLNVYSPTRYKWAKLDFYLRLMAIERMIKEKSPRIKVYIRDYYSSRNFKRTAVVVYKKDLYITIVKIIDEFLERKKMSQNKILAQK